MQRIRKIKEIIVIPIITTTTTTIRKIRIRIRIRRKIRRSRSQKHNLIQIIVLPRKKILRNIQILIA